jgi:hypothetical protein
MDERTMTKAQVEKTYRIEEKEIATMESSGSNLEWIEIRNNPGAFYQRMIPQERVSRSPQSWLFRNPGDPTV